MAVNNPGIDEPLLRRGLRWLPGLLIAPLICGGLLWLMQALIQHSQAGLAEDHNRQMLAFIRVRRTETAPPPPKTRPQRQQTPPPPPLPKLQAARAASPELSKISIPAAMPPARLATAPQGFFMPNIGEGDYLPMVKATPVYPPRARRKGIEGHCVVAYTVTAQGNTRNIRVLEEQCSHALFHDTAIKATRQFKYKPRIIDGHAVAVADVQTRFNFTLTE